MTFRLQNVLLLTGDENHSQQIVTTTAIVVDVILKRMTDLEGEEEMMEWTIGVVQGKEGMTMIAEAHHLDDTMTLGEEE